MGFGLIMDIGFINRMAVQRGAGTFPHYYKIVTIISWLFFIFLFDDTTGFWFCCLDDRVYRYAL